ncbi:hypothetical protein ES703_38929 [subsurface metagenome]
MTVPTLILAEAELGIVALSLAVISYSMISGASSGILNVPVNEPSALVVGVEGASGVGDAVRVIVFVAAKPVPVTVIVSPSIPAVGLKTILGSTVNVVVASVLDSMSLTTMP